jgi:tetratricopeptide (TPR) repeat protein
MRAHYAELQGWLARFPNEAGPSATWRWARGVSLSRALLALTEGKHAEGRRYLEEALAIARRVGDQPTIDRSLANLGRALYEVGDYVGAAAVLPEALSSSRQAGDRLREAMALWHSGTLAYGLGDYIAAQANCEASLAIATELDNAFAVIDGLCLRGDVALAQGDPAAATRQYEAAQHEQHEFNNPGRQPHLLIGLGLAALGCGDADRSQSLMLRGLRLSVEYGFRPDQVRALEALAGWAVAGGQSSLALRLAGASASYREHAGTPLFPTDQRLLRRALEPAYRALGAAASVDLERGRAMSLESAITLAQAAESMTSDAEVASSDRSG